MVTTKKVVVITGAYSGLGAALAEMFGEKGYFLSLSGRNKKKLDTFVAKVKKQTTAIGIVADVRKSSDCSNLIDKTIEKFGRIDVLINNAGVLYEAHKIENATDEELHDTFETNFFGPFYCIRAVLKVMKKQGFGHVINIGSSAAIDYTTSNDAYAASKAALLHLTGILHKSLENSAIKISIINPSCIKTSIFSMQPERDTTNFMDPRTVAKKIIEHIEAPSHEWCIVVRGPK